MQVINNIEDLKQAISANELFLLYASSEGCNVCTALLPKIEEMLTNYLEIKSAFVEIGEVPQVAGELSIFTIPAIILFIQGKESIREARFVDVELLNQKIKRYLDMFK